MAKASKSVQKINTASVNKSDFQRFLVGCLILSEDKKIILQQRGADWARFPNCLAEFGGQIEENESPFQALQRELHEELEVHVQKNEVIELGAITEMCDGQLELVYVYFWHDKQNTIQTCHEGDIKYFDNYLAANKQHNLMDSVRWLLEECKNRKLID